MELSFQKANCCQICNDTANGKNYAIFTCESCRTFLKRNGRKLNKFTCRKESKCSIDFTSRRSCPRCRLEKARSIGMKFKKGSKLQVLVTSPKPTDGNSKYNFEEMFVNYLYDKNLLTPDKLSIEPNEQIVSRKRKFATNLSYYERQMIGQIQNAMSLFEEEQTLPVRCVVTKLNDSINWPAFYAKRIIKFCKRMSPFNDLTKEDQLIILKPFYIQLISVRCYFMFDFKQKGYYVLADETGTEAMFISLKIADEYRCEEVKAMVEECKLLITKFRAVMEEDTVLRDLIIVYFLFRPNEKLSNMEYINYQHTKSCRLLLHYLEQKYKVTKTAADKYRKILKTIDEFDFLTKKGRVAFQEIDISLFSDLLLELYDLQTV